MAAAVAAAGATAGNSRLYKNSGPGRLKASLPASKPFERILPRPKLCRSTPMASIDDPLLHWLESLHERHLSTLKFSEVRKAVQALSSLYVERRERIGAAAAFTGAGKRAAFAMYFGPLHFLLVREIVRALDARVPADAAILDLGCGTGSRRRCLGDRVAIHVAADGRRSKSAGRFRNASGRTRR